MDIIQNLFYMDGQGKYVWFVICFFLVTIFINFYLPNQQIKLIKKEHSQGIKE
jgi:hypothetical protein